MEFDVKKASLGIAEDVLKMVIKDVVRPYAEAYVKKSENKIDDVILPFIDEIEKALLDIADKIDGEVG